MFGLFLLVVLSLGYWQVIQAPELASAPGNPRRIEQAALVQRGKLLDRNGQVLASSEPSADGLQRRYAMPAAAPVTGYHSLRFGDSGLEAEFNAQLSGQRTPDPLEQARSKLLGQAVVGSDVVSTIDARLQQTATEV